MATLINKLIAKYKVYLETINNLNNLDLEEEVGFIAWRVIKTNKARL